MSFISDRVQTKAPRRPDAFFQGCRQQHQQREELIFSKIEFVQKSRALWLLSPLRQLCDHCQATATQRDTRLSSEASKQQLSRAAKVVFEKGM